MGDRVKATCTVSTGGCLIGMAMLFECKTMCETQNPGTIVDQNKWGISSQCNQN
jgi:hypothetical protein